MQSDESFNIEFCEILNKYLMEAIGSSNHKLAHSCAMDGVLMPFVDSQLAKKSVNDTRKIETDAWALSDKGDIKFRLVIYFGKYSLRRYARGNSLEDCLPSLDSNDHIFIDFEKRQNRIAVTIIYELWLAEKILKQ